MSKVILLLLTVQLAFAAVFRHKDADYLNHVQMVSEFRCSEPQKRAIAVKDILLAAPDSDEIFYPSETVLRRCGGSGCCPEPEQLCAPIESRNISRVFNVKHKIDQQRERHHEIIHLVDHVKCGCINRTSVAATT